MKKCKFFNKMGYGKQRSMFTYAYEDLSDYFKCVNFLY